MQEFLKGKRVLYATPTQEQIERFWFEVCFALGELIDRGVYTKNETRHTIELPKTNQRIRAKTAWDADTLRGDYADLLILDEYQQMKPDAWDLVGAPMLADNDGDAVFIYTEKRGKHPGREMFRKAAADKTGRWGTFVFTSKDNPHISQKAIEDLAVDMTGLAYRREILAEDIEDIPGALWRRELIKYTDKIPNMERVVVAVDPEATSGEQSAETGIIVVGRGVDKNGYILADRTIRGTPAVWGRRAIEAYATWNADRIVAESNNGGEMVRAVLQSIDPGVPIKLVWASRGKITRAEPVSALYEQGKVFHVGVFPELEDQMCSYTGESGPSPDRMDALVWALTELMVGKHVGSGWGFQQGETRDAFAWGSTQG
jgi:predicted phage terminase large subunit-like protein